MLSPPQFGIIFALDRILSWDVYFVATTVLFDLRVFFTILKIHKTQLALPKWENVRNICVLDVFYIIYASILG